MEINQETPGLLAQDVRNPLAAGAERGLEMGYLAAIVASRVIPILIIIMEPIRAMRVEMLL